MAAFIKAAGGERLEIKASAVEIFLSYSRDDQALAAEYAARLEEEGFVVWWDVHIPLGDTFDRAIEERMARAQAALVLWTEHSVKSQWVRAEAATALESGKLVPVVCAPCELPIQFRHINALDMTDWRGETKEPAWGRLITAIREREDAAPSAIEAVIAPPVGVANEPPAYIVSPGGAPKKEFPVMGAALALFALIFGGVIFMLATM